MQKIVVRGVCRTNADGSRPFVGYLPADSEPPEGLMSCMCEMIDPEDGTPSYWVLAGCDRVPLLTPEDIDDLRSGEVARLAKAKLTDAELAALGLTRS